ncbi:MAG: hypothetical protein U5L09_01195 [Bacteroidales bacterium]|nr:hypothetical protein [Bacteroidales bacterium]
MIPTSRAEMDKLGWDQADVILFSGDAFVDHPAFGAAVLARMLQSDGFKVAVVPQPNWRDDLRDFKKLGKPALFFGVTAGNMDSMVNHYTANRRLRSDDAYTAGGQAGSRPDYATVVYSRILKDLFPDSLLFLGGIEASMRRFTHYDYWGDKLMPGAPSAAPADLLFYRDGGVSLTLCRPKNGAPAHPSASCNNCRRCSSKMPAAPTEKENTRLLHAHEYCRK